jgi:uncharacterized protein
MRVLVTGATGFIGKRVAALLHEKGHSVIVASRSGDKAKEKFPFPVTTVRWDAAEEFPVEALEELDAVIHLAGEGIADKRWTEKRKKAIYDSRVLGTRNLINAIKKAKSPPKAFVSTSAIGIYGDRENEVLTEDSIQGTGFLAKLCKDWEKEVSRIPLKVRWGIVRIGIVLGQDGGALKKLLPIFKIGAGGPVGTGQQWMSWVHLDDLARLFVHLATESSAQGVFNGTAPNPSTNAEFSKTLGHVLKRPAFLPAPAFALKIAMGELSELVLGSQRVTPKHTEEAGFLFQFRNLESALSDIIR